MGVDAREFPGGLLRLDPAFAYAKPPSSRPLPGAELAPGREGALGLSQFLGGEMTSSEYLFPQTLHVSTSSDFEVYRDTAANPVSISEGTLLS